MSALEYDAAVLSLAQWDMKVNFVQRVTLMKPLFGRKIRKQNGS